MTTLVNREIPWQNITIKMMMVNRKLLTKFTTLLYYKNPGPNIINTIKMMLVNRKLLG